MWTAEHTLKLIEDLQSNRCLWDVSYSDYRNRNKKADAMSQLAIKHNLSDAELEKKLHTLRGQFRREHKKLSRARKGGASSRCTWFGYEPLMFLLPLNEARKSRIIDNEGNEEVEFEDDIETSTNSMEDDASSIKLETGRSSTPITRPITARRTNDVADEVFPCVTSLSEVAEKRDGFSVFGEFLADSLRNCKRPRSEIYVAQHHINNTIFRLQMGGFDSNNQNAFPS